MRVTATPSFPIASTTQKPARKDTPRADHLANELRFRQAVGRIVAETGLSYGAAILHLRDTRPRLYADVTIARVGGRPVPPKPRRTRALEAANELEQATETLSREAGLSFRKALAALRCMNPDLYERGMQAMRAPTTHNSPLTAKGK